MSNIFHSCQSLTSIDLSYLNPVKVKTLDNMFNNCIELEFINLTDFKTFNAYDMKYMFKDCKNLTSLDLSDLNTSNVVTMNSMFSGCSKLNELDLTNFNTSKVYNMNEMFSNCEQLKKIELEKFNTSKVSYMSKMFCNCSNLKSVNLLNFNTSLVTDASYLFSGCSNVTSFILINFNTSNIKSMNNMFENCISITSLDLDKFNTSSANNMSYMFKGCNNLEYLDLCDFNTSKVEDMQYMFAGCEKLNILDLSKFDTRTCKNMEGMFMNCSSLEFINLSNFNTESVSNMENVFFGCNKLFYLNLVSFNYTKLENINSMFKNCTSLIYLNLGNSKISSINYKDDLFENIYKDINICSKEQSLAELFQLSINCSHDCFKENIKIIINEKTCIENCRDNDYYKYEYNKICFDKCPFGTHHVYRNEYLCEKDIKCNEFKINTTECKNYIPIGYYFDFNDGIYKPCYRSCYSCNMAGDINNNNCIEFLIDVYLDIFRSIVVSYNTSEIDNFGDYSEIVDNVIYTLTSTYNQKYNKYTNISSLDLSECEAEIINEYNISNDSIIYILKVDIFLPGALAPKVEYELYYPLNGSNLTLLNMSICKGTKTYIYLPTNISYEELYKHNPKSNFYNDICNTHTTESGTDIILNDRRNEFIDNKMNICEEDCELINMNEYYNSTRKVKCSCSTKTIIQKLSEIKIDVKKLLANFKNIKNMINLKLLECIQLLFDLNNIHKNFANYMLAFLIVLSIISLIVWSLNNYNKIKTTIESMIEEKKRIHKEKHKKNIIETEKENKENSISEDITIKRDKSIFLKIQSIMNKRFKIIDKKLGKKQKNIVIAQYINKIKIPKPKKNRNNILNIKTNFKKRDNSKNSFIKNNYINTTMNSNIKNVYNDNEMNLLKYKKAKKIDKRTYMEYYFSLLKTKHLLFFTFFYSEDYNSKLIKIYIFFFSIQIEYTINAMFYSDKTMHKIYKDEGTFDIIYQIPQMLYSSLLSLALNNLISFLGLYEDNILKIKNCKYKEIKKLKDESYFIKIKIIIFYIVTYILLFCFWIYVGCFCAVYKNTQLHLLIEVLSSFILSFILSFFIYFIPGIFRILSLKDGPKSNNPLMYKFSLFLQDIL